MKNFHFSALLLLIFCGCSNLEDAELTDRKTFMRFYESANSIVASGVEITSDKGYIICGTVVIEGDVRIRKMLVIKVDEFGQREWEQRYDGGSASAILETADGYILIGDSINTTTVPVTSKSRVLTINKVGEVLRDSSYASKDGNDSFLDYHGTALTMDDDANELITLGTHVNADGTVSSDIIARDPVTLTRKWSQSSNYLQRNYSNGRKVFYQDGHILWGSTIVNNSGTQSYFGIPYIIKQSSFINNDYFGDDENAFSYNMNDLQKVAGGYAAIGTYSEAGGSNSNMFFVRINDVGTIDDESIRYYDGITSGADGFLDNKDISSIEDTGNAIIQTSDRNYVLAGTILTNLEKGNGGRDIRIMKVNSNGTQIWTKLLGGKSTEVVTSIRETEDGGLILCGTIQDGSAQVGGLSSIFLFKTTSNGELKK